MRFPPLRRFALICLIFVWGISPPADANDKSIAAATSLRGYDWTTRYDWITDFEYERIEVTSQKKLCVAYTLDMKIEHVRRLRERKLPYVGPTASANEEWIIGMTPGWSAGPEISPQPLFGYVITNPEAEGPKLRVVLAGGNHPNEHPACWTLHALVEFLVSDDPRARTLRNKAAFYVYPSVNPEGKLYLKSPAHQKLMTGQSNPELMAAGERNHNRVWHMNGKFRSIDLIKRAMLQDTGGRPDYLLDFHGIPRTSVVFAGNDSPLSRALYSTEPGINQRLTLAETGMLSGTAVDPEWLGTLHRLTPEIANMSKEDLFKQGLHFALALHNVVTGNVPETLERNHPDIVPVMPPPPVAGWLFNGNLQAAFGEIPDGTGHGVDWSEDCRFENPEGRSLRLDGKGAYVDFGQPKALDLVRSMTVALWVKGKARPVEAVTLIGRHAPSGDRRSWALAQRPNSGELLAIISSNGTQSSGHFQRKISSLWPVQEVFDGQWRHIACTFQGGDERRLLLYVDGSELEIGRGGHYFDQACVRNLHLPDVPLTIGTQSDACNFFEGLIDEAAIWNVALSPDQIRWLFQNSIAGLVPKP